MPKFSVIVSFYNQRDYLGRVMEALAQQTCTDFEVHLCDDGSDDGTKEEVEKNLANAPFPLMYHRSEVNTRSYARTMNHGVRAATGKYLVFIAGDSFPEPDYLEILEEYVQENRVVCGVRFQVAEVDGVMQGVDIDWRLKKELIPTYPSLLASEPWLLMTGNGLCVPASAMRKYGPWREDFVGYGGEDNELVARLYFKGYLCWSVPDLRVYHHWHPSKSSEVTSTNKAVEAITSYAS